MLNFYFKLEKGKNVNVENKFIINDNFIMLCIWCFIQDFQIDLYMVFSFKY